MRRPTRQDRTPFSAPSGRVWSRKSEHDYLVYHRRSGPAIELDDGTKRWCWNGCTNFWQTSGGFYLSGGGSAPEGHAAMNEFPGYEESP